MVCALSFFGVVILDGVAGDPPPGPEAVAPSEKPRKTRVREYNKTITMHQIDGGKSIEIPSDGKSGRNELKLNQRRSSSFSFEESATPFYPPPVSPNQSRKGKPEQKKKNWLTPKSNLDGLGQNPEGESNVGNSILDKGKSWGWLADEVREQQAEEAAENKKRSRDPELLLNGEADLVPEDFASEEEYIQHRVSQQLKAKEEQASGMEETDYRAGGEDQAIIDEQPVESYADLEAVGAEPRQRDSSRSVDTYQEESKPSWGDSFSSLNSMESGLSSRANESRLDQLNDSFRKNYAVSPGSSELGKSPSLTSFDSTASFTAPSISAGNNPQPQASLGVTPRFTPSPSSSFGSSPTETRSIYSLPSSTSDRRIENAPQQPQQAFQPFSSPQP